ncbi:aspartate/glutamate racemase family protein [Treponema sp. OMZ 840]|uniref:aspartate/glutamate racemase family protein n=1 Tax=Treponema sp. OMZ 840 TaxID=244313 RepID=UPI003D9194BF
MKKIMLLHTVKTVYESFGAQLKELVKEDIILNNILDDFLADDPARNEGVFSKNNRLRLHKDLESAQLAEPDLIVVTCSTLSPYIPELRTYFTTPIMAIDDAMCEEALKKGDTVAVLATAVSAVTPIVQKLESMGQMQGRNLKVVSYCNPEAIAALKSGDKKTHDTLVLEMAQKVKNADVIVFAQASTAHMADQIIAVTGIPALASPRLCQQKIADFLMTI